MLIGSGRPQSLVSCIVVGGYGDSLERFRRRRTMSHIAMLTRIRAITPTTTPIAILVTLELLLASDGIEVNAGKELDDLDVGLDTGCELS